MEPNREREESHVVLAYSSCLNSISPQQGTKRLVTDADWLYNGKSCHIWS